ncbi:MAG: hypothetical protein A4E57_03886 [Syntrophorhabdaceae bacterium PtaU1.Bin034]|nr:MAG: hypothetical protein A4E57_03886 [Syntrophorhabdaceae bacterium PtaU1.Bin034]
MKSGVFPLIFCNSGKRTEVFKMHVASMPIGTSANCIPDHANIVEYLPIASSSVSDAISFSYAPSPDLQTDAQRTRRRGRSKDDPFYESPAFQWSYHRSALSRISLRQAVSRSLPGSRPKSALLKVSGRQRACQPPCGFFCPCLSFIQRTPC